MYKIYWFARLEGVHEVLQKSGQPLKRSRLDFLRRHQIKIALMQCMRANYLNKKTEKL